jgi:predicted AlkP superfamily pyrophosphatase or phosphodiesterase
VADSLSTILAVEELRTGNPDALFLYLGNPDETSHHHGSIGEEYRAAIAAADRAVGRVMEALRGRRDFRGEDWLVLVSTDHGRTAAGGHGGDTPEESAIFILVSGSAAERGEIAEGAAIVDVAATALTHLRGSLDPAWELDGRPVGLRSR